MTTLRVSITKTRSKCICNKCLKVRETVRVNGYGSGFCLACLLKINPMKKIENSIYEITV